MSSPIKNKGSCNAIYNDVNQYNVIIIQPSDEKNDAVIFDSIDDFKERIQSASNNNTNNNSNNTSINSDAFLSLHNLTVLSLLNEDDETIGFIHFRIHPNTDDSVLTIEYVKSHVKGLGKKLLYLVTCIAQDLGFEYISFEALPYVSKKGRNNNKNKSTEKAQKLFKYYNNLGFTRKANTTYASGLNNNKKKVQHFYSQHYKTKISGGTRKKRREF